MPPNRSDRPPNLLFVFTDEQRVDTLAAYGNTRIEMPNLNRLASQSHVFDRAYVTQPVCTPSRSTLLTGLWPHTSGCTANNVPLAEATPCLPEMLPAGRWATAYHGKWHLGDEIFAQHGFEQWRSVEDLYRPHYSPGRDRSARSTYHHWLLSRGITPADGDVFGRDETARLPEEHGKPAYLAGEASRYIREHRHEPFVLFVNFLEPHMPFFGPRDAQYAPADVSLPGNFDAPPTEDQPLKTRLYARSYYERGHSGLPLKTEADWRRMIANYWGLCSLVDTHVGAILETLDDCGLAERTIVVFTSDHGDMMGSHRLLAKCTQFEEAVRVPMLIRLPGQREGRRVAGPVSHIDLLPTLLDYLGVEPPAHVQGRSLRPQMEAGAPPREVFVEWNGANTGLEGLPALHGTHVAEYADAIATRGNALATIHDPVRTIITPDGWKLNASPLGEHELYNLTSDPQERRNRAGLPEDRPLMRALCQRIAKWQRRTGDAVELPEI